MTTTKELLRKQFLKAREAISYEDRRKAAARALENLQIGASQIPLARVKTVGLYAPIRGELETAGFFYFFQEQGFRCAYPRVGAGDLLKFGVVGDILDLRPGRFGVLEPPAGQPCEPELILVPGLAFSLSGDRLGYGKGFYDRWIGKRRREKASLFCIGLAFDVQVSVRLPAQREDQKMDALATDTQFLRF